MKVKVTKVNGNKNTFVLLYNQKFENGLSLSADKIKKLCKINKNISVDGLLNLNYFSRKNITLEYYNNDGSWETLCVNGLRCAALYIYNLYQIDTLEIQCGDGIHKTIKIGNNISVSMPKPKYVSKKINIQNISGDYINSGAKHFVLPFINHFDKKQILNLAKKIRYDTKTFPDGVNVNFYKIINKDKIEVITYEKGIEGIVDSCASGSFACAYHLLKNQLINNNITVVNKGGLLNIIFDKNYKDNYIISDAEIEKNYIVHI